MIHLLNSPSHIFFFLLNKVWRFHSGSTSYSSGITTAIFNIFFLWRWIWNRVHHPSVDMLTRKLLYAPVAIKGESKCQCSFLWVWWHSRAKISWYYRSDSIKILLKEDTHKILFTLLLQHTNASEFSQRAPQSNCHALCKISGFIDYHGCYG